MVARLARGARAARSLALVALLAPGLAGCAYGVGDLFGDDPPPPPPPVFVPKTQAEGGTSAGDTAADDNAQFPNLGQVPERPLPTTTAAERRKVAEQLAADRRNAQYTRERLTGEMSDGGAGSSARAPEPSGSEAVVPPPSASPAGTEPAADDSSIYMPAEPAAAAAVAAEPVAEPVPTAEPVAASSESMAASGSVPPPPSAASTATASAGDEAEAARRAIESRGDLTAGTNRGSAMQARGDTAVLERTERLTAALTDPATDGGQVDAFTRRMAERSPAARAAAPSSDGHDGGSAVQDDMPASSRADALLAERAAAELEAYAAARTRGQSAADFERTPEPVLVTTAAVETVETGPATAFPATELDAVPAGAPGGSAIPAPPRAAIVEDSVTVEELTPSGRVTTVERVTETVAVAPQPAMQQPVPAAPVRPQPRTLEEIYEAQLRASSAASLQQAAQAGAPLAGAPAGYPAPQPQSIVPPQPYPTAAAPVPAPAYGRGTVVVSSSGVSGGGPAPMPTYPAAPSYPAPAAPVHPAAGAYPIQPVALQAPVPGAPVPGGGVPGNAVKVATVRFASGSTRLGSGDIASLRQVVDLYRQQGGQVLVVGHASSRTPDMSPERHKRINYEVSLARAEAVAEQLRAMGIPAGAILVEGRSDLEPIYYEAMPAAEAANRRAEIYFVR